MAKDRILYVEDDPDHMKKILADLGVEWADPVHRTVVFPLNRPVMVATTESEIVLCSNQTDALEELKSDPDILCVIADLRIPDRHLGVMQNEGGKAVFQFMRDHGMIPHTQFVLITSYGTDDLGRRLFEEGIYDYFSKGDFVDANLRDSLRRIIKRAVEKAKLFRRSKAVQQTNVLMKQDRVADTISLCTRVNPETVRARNTWRQSVFDRMDERTRQYIETLEEKGEFAFVGRSPETIEAFNELLDLAEQQGDRPGLNMMIHGPAGVGKSAFALLLHLLSPRAMQFDFILRRIVAGYHQLLTVGPNLGYQFQKEFQGILESEFQLIPKAYWSRHNLPEEVLEQVRQALDGLYVRRDAVSQKLDALLAHAYACWKSDPKFNFRIVPGASWVGETAITDLFGSRKGAYTGADSTRPGDFQIVSHVGGTLCIDDIDCLHHSAQMLFLNAIEKPFEVGRKGSTAREKVDVMLIATTNKYQTFVDSFDKGFVRRLGYHHLEIRPMDQRREDIPLLVDHFLLQSAVLTGQSIDSIEEDALKLLTYEMQWEYHAASIEQFIGEFSAFHAKKGAGRTVTRRELIEFAERKQNLNLRSREDGNARAVPASVKAADMALTPLPEDDVLASLLRNKGCPESIRGIPIDSCRRMLIRLLIELGDFKAIREMFKVHPVTLFKIYEGEPSCDNKIFSPPDQNAFAWIARDLALSGFNIQHLGDQWGFSSSKPVMQLFKKSTVYLPREGRKRGESAHGHRLLYQFVRMVKLGTADRQSILRFWEHVGMEHLSKPWIKLLEQLAD